MSFKVGDRVREVAETAVSQDPYLRLINEISGHDWNEVPAQLEGTITDTTEDGRFVVTYSNAPAWAPATTAYPANCIEPVDA